MAESGQNLLTRLWQKDPGLWPESKESPDSAVNRLGWLDAVEWMEQHAGELTDWALDIAHSGKFDHVILLGMGGSSLAAEVFASLFGQRPGHLKLIVLDTTSPAQINAVEVELGRTLFIVASKSGTTVETADLFSYFHYRLLDEMDSPGENLVAITDEGSWLHKKALESGFRKIFLNPADIGGRYSALSYFGLVPAALVGVNISRLLEHTRKFQDKVKNDTAGEDVVRLGRLMGDGAQQRKSKLELVLGDSLTVLAVWIEQLVAESTGKDGKGIIPVYDDPGIMRRNQVDDRISVHIGLDENNQETPQRGMTEWDMQWNLKDPYDLGGEFLRWELATVLAASIMDINPFDQPNVEEAKKVTRTFIKAGKTLSLGRIFVCDQFFLDGNFPRSVARSGETFSEVFNEFGAASDRAAYLGILAFLPNFAETTDALQAFRGAIARYFKITTTLGFGPRYLHSTGQLHKGGPPTGCFIQIVEDSAEDIQIPGQDYGFAALHQAQADGDYSVLEGKGRPVMRITLKGDRLRALNALTTQLG